MDSFRLLNHCSAVIGIHCSAVIGRFLESCCSWAVSWKRELELCFLKSNPCPACQLWRFLVIVFNGFLPGCRIVFLNSCRVMVLFSCPACQLFTSGISLLWCIWILLAILLGYRLILLKYCPVIALFFLNSCRYWLVFRQSCPAAGQAKAAANKKQRKNSADGTLLKDEW